MPNIGHWDWYSGTLQNYNCASTAHKLSQFKCSELNLPSYHFIVFLGKLKYQWNVIFNCITKGVYKSSLREEQLEAGGFKSS